MIVGWDVNAQGQPMANFMLGRLVRDLPMNVRIQRHVGGNLLRGVVVNPDSPIGKAPAALEALKEIEKATAQVRAAKDVDSTLKALEDMEKALMKIRSELWKLKEKAKQKQDKDGG